MVHPPHPPPNLRHELSRGQVNLDDFEKAVLYADFNSRCAIGVRGNEAVPFFEKVLTQPLHRCRTAWYVVVRRNEREYQGRDDHLDQWSGRQPSARLDVTTFLRVV
eukprot:scaffold110733_cov66-Phaeocystis_antarctica.AAC.3